MSTSSIRVCGCARRPAERTFGTRPSCGRLFFPSVESVRPHGVPQRITHTYTYTHTPTYNGFFGSVSGSQRRGRGARMRTARVVGGWPPVAVRDSRAAILDFCVADVTSSLFTSHYLNKLICWEYCITRTSSGLPPPLSTSPVKE